MPELPEVETVRRGLEPAMVGASFRKVEQNRPDLRFPLPDRFATRLRAGASSGSAAAPNICSPTWTTLMCS